ncbi:hypothetical protein ACPV5S_20105 [Vibrio astriarenae]
MIKSLLEATKENKEMKGLSKRELESVKTKSTVSKSVTWFCPILGRQLSITKTYALNEIENIALKSPNVSLPGNYSLAHGGIIDLIEDDFNVVLSHERSGNTTLFELPSVIVAKQVVAVMDWKADKVDLSPIIKEVKKKSDLVAKRIEKEKL